MAGFGVFRSSGISHPVRLLTGRLAEQVTVSQLRACTLNISEGI
jgi:hypothetical protein